jgi:predicted metal-binding membrane protein
VKIGRFHVAAVLVFTASAAVTIAWCGSMSGMPGMEMPGGWTMSMAWMRMPGQGWLGYAGTFIGMWAVMMVAMMLPAFMPMLASYGRSLSVASLGAPKKRALGAVVVAGYFATWILFGLALLPPGTAFAELAMRIPAVSQAVPVMGALVVLAAGLSQFTAWKSRRLACCRHTIDCCRDRQPGYRAAWRHGLKIGARCVHSCAGLTAVLLVIGVMDLLAMALVTIAISAERLMPERSRAPRVIGASLLALGAAMLSETMLFA